MKKNISKTLMQLLIASMGIFLFQVSALAALEEANMRLDARTMSQLAEKMANLAQKDPQLYKEVAKEFKDQVEKGKIAIERSNERAVKEQGITDNKEIRSIETKVLDSKKDELLQKGMSQADFGKLKEAINTGNKDIIKEIVEKNASALDAKGKEPDKIMKEMIAKDPAAKDLVEKIASREMSAPVEHNTAKDVVEHNVIDKIARETLPYKEVVVKEFFKEVDKSIVDHQLKESGVSQKDIKDISRFTKELAAPKEVAAAKEVAGSRADIGSSAKESSKAFSRDINTKDFSHDIKDVQGPRETVDPRQRDRDSVQARLDRQRASQDFLDRQAQARADASNHDDFDSRDKANAELKNEPAGSSIVSRIEKGKTIFHVDDHDGDANDTPLKK